MFVIIAVFLIILIMLQQNNGNSLGGGLDRRAFGDLLNTGDFNNNITRLIIILAVLFFLFSLFLGNMNSKYNQLNIKNYNHNNSINQNK